MKPVLTTIAIVLAILAVATIAVGVWQRHRMVRPNFKNLDDMMQFLAASAVENAGQNGVRLDYSPDSIKKVDEVLGKIHDEYVQTKPSDGVRGLAMAYGAYIGEVIKRTDPSAKWEKDDSFAGPNSYPLIWRGGSSYVVAWCYRRIVEGEEDNVWFKYIAIRDRSPDKNQRDETNKVANR